MHIPFFTLVSLALTNSWRLSSHSHSLVHAHPHVNTNSHSHTRSHINASHLQARALPGDWSFFGCYTDGNPRTLNAAAFTNGNTMSSETCVAFCNERGYVYAGTEYSAECYCDNSLHAATSTPASDCGMVCAGDATETCGGPNRLSVYWSGEAPPPPPVMPEEVGNWDLVGCYTDNVGGAGRTLDIGQGVDGLLTLEKCTAACFSRGYQYAGTEYAGECYCDSAIGTGGTVTPDGDCSMTCAGDSSQLCGGPNRLTLYHYGGTDLPPITNPGGGGGGGGAPVFPVTSGLPGTWAYAGCYVDNAFGRIIEAQQPADNVGNTVESCIAQCVGLGYTIAGTEFGEECYCGNRLINGAAVSTDATCNVGCSGNTTEACGGANRLSVYSSHVGNITILPVPTILQDNLPGNWEYSGCYTDEVGGERPLPWQIIWIGNNTVEACLTQCSNFGYTAAGLEYGQECYCGDVSDLESSGSTLVDDSECGISCPGDPIHLCGDGARLQTYTWDGVLNVWHEPANIGRYEFFVPGVVVPLIATLGINNKVTFLEKHGTGFANSTGAYELDLSLVNSGNWEDAWREMHGVTTDVFCAGSIILPDKAGRQINVGGWSLESTFGVRLFTPDGAPGEPSTNDWEESYPDLALQRGRWYPTAAMLPNGSILVVGGETGSNAAAQPNLEILPKPAGGDTVLELDWLARTDPWNLYPFLVVLPGGNLFVSYWNEARILDINTFETVKSLPNMPGSVNNFEGGRTYPLEGSLLLWPQHAPYTDPLKVVMCGGSTPGPAIVLDNCVSIAPEVEGAQWELERMPSRRVLSCMVNLPDGTMMIMNGAHEGVAGFGLAQDPNLSAILYDPSQPLGQRFSILNSTIVPRMYHSEATLLPDGSVLVSGSDPQTPGFDEEFRIERYIPPYLNEGRTQPEFDLPANDWAYGGSYQLTNVVLHHGTIASNIRVSLVAATSSTHGNTMGSRTIFPAFSCAGTTCTVVAPPNANISPPGWHQLFILDGPTPSFSKWVRIGGDPAQLGNWPDLPGFTLPGL